MFIRFEVFKNAGLSHAPTQVTFPMEFSMWKKLPVKSLSWRVAFVSHSTVLAIAPDQLLMSLCTMLPIPDPDGSSLPGESGIGTRSCENVTYQVLRYPAIHQTPLNGS